VACVREQIENGRIYLHEFVFGDPAEPDRFEEPLHRFQNMIGWWASTACLPATTTR